MRIGLRWMQTRLRQRADSEHAQVFVRIAINSLFAAYLGWEVLGGGSAALFATWWILLGECALSIGLLVAILLSPGPSHPRRWLGMLADYAAMGGVMYLQGETAAPLYAAYLWVTIGNGMRYGTGYLFAATALATLSFLLMMCDHPVLAGQSVPVVGPVDRPGRGAAVLRVVAAGADRRDRGRAPGEPGKEPVPGQHEPRVPHPVERPVGDVGTAGEHPPGQRAARLPGDHPGGVAFADVAGGGRARHLGDRGGQAQAEARGIRAARVARRHRADPAPGRAFAPAGLRGGGLDRGVAAPARRSGAPAPGPAQPARQCDQVHPVRRSAPAGDPAESVGTTRGNACASPSRIPASASRPRRAPSCSRRSSRPTTACRASMAAPAWAPPSPRA